MNGVPRVPVAAHAIRDSSPARPFGPHYLNLGNGDLLVNDAHDFCTGIRSDGQRQIITIVLGRNPDTMPHGMGLVYQASCAEVRDIAASLVRIADEVEANAATAASEVIARAGKRGAA